MASTVLTGTDFVSNSNGIIVANDGALILDSVYSNDFNIGIVSRDAFDFSSGNIAARFVFSVSPEVGKIRAGKYGKGGSGKFVAVIDDGDGASWKNSDGTSSCQGSPNCETMSPYECVSFYDADVSSSMSVVKTGATVCASGGDDTGASDISQQTNVVSVACGNGFSVAVLSDGNVVLFGDDNGGALAVPESLQTFTDDDKPIYVKATESAYAVLRRNGTVDFVGFQGDAPQLNNVVSIDSGSNFIVATTLSGRLVKVAVDTSDVTEILDADVEKASCANGTIAWITSDAEVGVSTGANTEFPVALQRTAIDVIAGDGFAVVVHPDRTFTIVGQAPSYMDQFLGSHIGPESSVLEHSPVYKYYPMLKFVNGTAIAFGVQNDTLDASYELYQTGSGESRPVIVGKTGSLSVFEAIASAIKGAIVARADNGSDYAFDLQAIDIASGAASGHIPVGGDFLSFGETDKLEILVGFSSFGKAIRLRINREGSYTELPMKHLSVQEDGFTSGRVAIYVKSASNFRLEYAEVTDEGDFALLPADVVYRDIDTAILQSKAAEMVTEIGEAVESVSDLSKLIADKVIELNEDYKTKMTDVLNRLSALEEQ